MIKEIELKLLPKEAAIEQVILQKAAQQLRLQASEISDLRVVRRSIDARGVQPFFFWK